jgi:hypothetical protein
MDRTDDEAAFDDEGPDDAPLVTEPTERHIKSIKDVKMCLPIRPTTALVPHAEQTLLFHHLQNPDIAPFTYVAVRELSCLLCS